MSFFDEFNHIVPYFINVNVGKNKQFKTDPNKKSDSNHKGKMVAYYTKPKTLEELKKYGFGEHIEYLPAEQVSMPIDIQVTSEEKLTPFFEESCKYTNKEMTEHKIRLYDTNKSQVGYVSISLTPSGDIFRKTCFYESPDGTEQIKHTIYNDIIDGNFLKDDHFEFKKSNEKETKKIRVSQRNGKVVGCSVLEQDIETEEDLMLQPITRFSIDKKSPKLKRYVTSCVVDEPDHCKRGGTLIPWECMTLEDDLFEYQNSMDKFQKFVKFLKERRDIEFSIEKAIEIGNLSYDEREKHGFGFSSMPFDVSYYLRLAKYLADESNNRLRDFKGDYIGNILKLTDKGYEACIVTKHQKDGQDYRLYTLIDFTGTSITRGTGMDEYRAIRRDPNYFERLENADKTPTFVTKLREDGKEELVLYRGNEASGECPEYDEFVKDFISPFSEIKPIKISKFLNKQSEKEQR